MIYAGIDIAKDKHDCFITNSDGKILYKPFTITNNREGYEDLFNRICSATEDFTKVKVGLEATGQYSYNLLGFLVDKGPATFIINPLHTNLYRKSLSLRQTKTDKCLPLPTNQDNLITVFPYGKTWFPVSSICSL